PGVSPVMPVASTRTRIDRIAVYSDHGPPTIWTRPATVGWAYLTGRVLKEEAHVNTPWGWADVGQLRGTVFTQVSTRPHEVGVEARIHVHGILTSWPPLVPLTAQRLGTLQRLVARSILQDCQAAIAEANRTHTDPFGYARSLFWQQMGLSPFAFSPTLSHLPINAQISVKVEIRDVGVSQ
ncbi:MAG: Ger(x)C family spore germination C-terminal domain-containing protein, partial [Firmicutes bacterium]|nr:Ger(x)C family spore germination C-terminal domain-containing protein [Bacillota bacterium]